MSVPQADIAFAGSIPQIYERYLVPLIFEPYAIDLEGRVAKQLPTRVLEIAAGTGVVTRRLAKTLPPSTAIESPPDTAIVSLPGHWPCSSESSRALTRPMACRRESVRAVGCWARTCP